MKNKIQNKLIEKIVNDLLALDTEELRKLVEEVSVDVGRYYHKGHDWASIYDEWKDTSTTDYLRGGTWYFYKEGTSGENYKQRIGYFDIADEYNHDFYATRYLTKKLDIDNPLIIEEDEESILYNGSLCLYDYPVDSETKMKLKLINDCIEAHDNYWKFKRKNPYKNKKIIKKEKELLSRLSSTKAVVLNTINPDIERYDHWLHIASDLVVSEWLRKNNYDALVLDAGEKGIHIFKLKE